MSRIISEVEFNDCLRLRLATVGTFRGVTGPGRSGAIASVYASHYLGIPWLPFGQPCPDALRPLLIIDTAQKSGATMRRALRKYDTDLGIAIFDEPPRLRFWYEPHPTTHPNAGESDA